MSQLPPQAYTRDVLSTAYEWLRNQPASIRELATDADSLVALYFQSRRNPQSLNNMLNQSTGYSESRAATSAATAQQTQQRGAAPAAHGTTTSAHSVNTNKPVVGEEVLTSSEVFKQDLKTLAEGLRQFDTPPTKAPLHASLYAQVPQSVIAASQVRANVPASQVQSATVPSAAAPAMAAAPQPTTSSTTHLQLDSKSHEALRQVQSLLNLSSDKEALRMLIALGFDRIKEILPKN